MNKVILLVLSGYFVLGVLTAESGKKEVVQNTLKCYQCIIQGRNESVCDNDLKVCPNYQAFDKCTVNIKRNRTTGDFTITKGCALAPCQLEKEVEAALGFTDKCDLSRRDADCVECCDGDGCNKRSSAVFLNSNPLLFTLTISSTISIIFQVFITGL